jgi:hypothetical protein
MPDIAMPNGDIVNFPDDMPKEQIKGLIASKFPEVAKPKSSPAMDVFKGAKEGIKQGTTFGFNDEIQAGVAAGSVGLQNLIGMDTGGLKAGEAYDQALNDFRQQSKEAKANAGGSFLAGELAGALTSGAGIAKAAPAFMTGGTGGTALQGAIGGGLRGAGGGALSGGVYGFGTGEGGAASRIGNAAMVGALGGGIGGVAGAAGGALSNSLANRAAKLLEIKRAAQNPTPPSMTGGSPIPQGPAGPTSSAIGRVVDKLRKDYPDEAQFQQVMQKLQSGEVTLAELGGPQTQNLAKGAAQYPSGEVTMTKFFEGVPDEVGGAPVGGAINQARQNITNSIEKNISGNTDFLGTLDDVVKKGQIKAAPLYEKANTQFVVSDKIKIPEVQSAIQAAKQKFPSELEGLPDNSVKVLDYAKRVLDDQIETARRAGEGNFARSRTEIKNALVSEIDSQVPDYAKARKVAGDYLSNKSALEAGREFKGNSKQISRDFSKLGDTEKEAFRIGVVDKVREMTDKVRDNGNAYAKIFGTPETRAKLKAVLPPDKFKQLSDDLWASDRIYGLRNKVLGNSTTTSKAISAGEFAMSENEVLQQLASGRPIAAGISGATQWVKRAFDGLSDKDAGEVARILTAKNETDKLKIIRQIADRIDPKAAAKTLPEGRQLQTYFAVQDMLKPYRGGPLAGSAGALASQPLQITVRPSDANWENK